MGSVDHASHYGSTYPCLRKSLKRLLQFFGEEAEVNVCFDKTRKRTPRSSMFLHVVKKHDTSIACK